MLAMSLEFRAQMLYRRKQHIASIIAVSSQTSSAWNARVVHAEYAEESVVLPHSTSSNGTAIVPLRQHKWQQILRERPRLAESIQAATGWRIEWIPNRCARLGFPKLTLPRDGPCCYGASLMKSGWCISYSPVSQQEHQLAPDED